MESCLPHTYTEILPLEFRILISKWLILSTYKPLKINQLMSLILTNYLHITAVHMVTFSYEGILACHFVMKI